MMTSDTPYQYRWFASTGRRTIGTQLQ